VSPSLTREQALRMLELPPSAPRPAVKRAYRRLARRHHPDVGGDPETFHRLHQAAELLLEAGTGVAAPRVARGRPSRASADWNAGHAADPSPVDLASVDWSARCDGPGTVLTRELVAVRLARASQAPVEPLTATSRAPGSRLNRVAAKLSPDLTAHVEIRPGHDDRGREVVLIEIVASSRRARRALDTAPLRGEWMRLRGSSTSRLRATLPPSRDRRATALRAADHLADLLERLAWPLNGWTLTR
jgi:hypothetical protein